MMEIVALNGALLPLEQASVSVMDRGFLFGDGVYEVIPCYAGQLFRWEQHLTRLKYSLQETRISVPFTDEEWKHHLERVINANDIKNCSVYLQVTRGVQSVRDHRFQHIDKPTIFIRVTPLPDVDEKPSAAGKTMFSVDDIRWKRCDIKAITLLANCLARQEAEEAGADEALMIHDGYAIEGSASNVFMIKNDELFTPPKSPKILGGITRDLVVELAKSKGLKVTEQVFTLEELMLADEVWITSSTREIQPVVKIDHQTIGSGVAGPIFAKMSEWYVEFKRELYAGRCQ